jgi:hypothetical protein
VFPNWGAERIAEAGDVPSTALFRDLASRLAKESREVIQQRSVRDAGQTLGQGMHHHRDRREHGSRGREAVRERRGFGRRL